MIDWSTLLVIALALLLVQFALGIPVYIAFFSISALGIVTVFGEAGYGMLANSIYSSVTSSSLTAIPLFVLMGEVLFGSGVTEHLFNAINRLLGRLHGRLCYLVLLLATIFGALSGSIIAVTATLGRSLVPSMRARNYDDTLNATAILAGASLAPIIPPSIAVIVLGSLVDVSIGGLMIAGILPGLTIAILSSVWIFMRLKLRPELAPVDHPDAEDETPLHLVLLRCVPFTLIIFSVIGFIMLGIATPSESAASGVAGALLAAGFYRKLTWQLIKRSLYETVKITTSILIIYAASKLFSQLLAFTGATGGLVSFVTSLDLNPGGTFIAMMAVTLVACMFIDLFAFMLVAIPLFSPLVASSGFDPLWFWTIFLINITLGAITPPFGYAIFALKVAVEDLEIITIYRAASGVVAIFLICMVLFYFVPGIVTLLPSLL